MICNFTHFSIALLWFLPVFSSAQTEPMDLSLEQSLTLLRSENKSLRIAGKEVELAKNEHQKLNAFWYPTISAAGAYVHMSNPIEVRQSLNQFTDPAKEYVPSILPNDQFISSLLDKIGQNTLTLPLISQNITSIDANLIWPIFTGRQAHLCWQDRQETCLRCRSQPRTGKREPTDFADRKLFWLTSRPAGCRGQDGNLQLPENPLRPGFEVRATRDDQPG